MRVHLVEVVGNERSLSGAAGCGVIVSEGDAPAADVECIHFEWGVKGGKDDETRFGPAILIEWAE